LAQLKPAKRIEVAVGSRISILKNRGAFNPESRVLRIGEAFEYEAEAICSICAAL
jgi:hypothetical protein